MTSLYCSSARLLVALLAGTAMVAACTEDGDTNPGFTPPLGTGDSAVQAGTGGADAAAAIPGSPSGSQSGGTAGGTAGGTGGAATTDAGAAPSAGGLPCDVKKIVDAKCAATCHTDPPQGTFMALKTHAQWLATGTSDKSKKYWELAKMRVNATGPTSMPPPGSTQLTAEDKTALNAWLNSGAPASTESCGAAPDAGVAPDAGPSDVSGLECYKFLAHAQGDKKAKFKVGQVKDAYWNFGFKAPWTEMRYGIVVRPIIDNATALHHWLIYKEDIQDGLIEKTIGQHGSGELIHGWAPGGIEMDFRKHGDVAFELPPTSYAVEFHYNSADPNAMDASGVELCMQKTPPKNVASMTWLGYDNGGAVSYATGICSASKKWTGTCKPAAQKEPIHLVFMSPHLHQTGRHLKSVIKGVDGKERVLHDKAFDFNYQITYETQEVLMPGETITTSCDFSEAKCAGQSTSQEMCYLFTYAWPKLTLVDNGPEGTLMHGKGVCLGQ
jgi:hypothetical protein